MISPTILAAILSAVPLTLALPQITDATSANPTVFIPWSSHPLCAAPRTACKADCTKAVETLCNQDLSDLTNPNIIETVGDCTAWYLYEIGNTVPSPAQCLSAFGYINEAAKPGPDGCGGTFGGALGWDKDGNRTGDPAFAIYPKEGNGNCFKRVGDETPPLAQDMLPDGTRLPIGQCPAATSRLVRNKRDGFRCFVEDGVWQLGCNAVCIGSITASTWWTGPAVAAGWLACLGGCDAVGYKLANNCMKKYPDPEPKLLKARDGPLPDACESTMDFAFECPAVQQGLLAFHKCPGSTADPDGGSNTGGRGDGTINT